MMWWLPAYQVCGKRHAGRREGQNPLLRLPQLGGIILLVRLADQSMRAWHIWGENQTLPLCPSFSYFLQIRRNDMIISLVSEETNPPFNEERNHDRIIRSPPFNDPFNEERNHYWSVKPWNKEKEWNNHEWIHFFSYLSPEERWWG